MQLRILRSFKTIPLPSGRIGGPVTMSKQEVSKVLQYRPCVRSEVAPVDLDWIDVPTVDFDEDTGEYIAPSSK